MGAHLMASQTVAPISTSKGPGIDLIPHVFQYPGAHDAQIVVYATSKNATTGLAKAVSEAAAAAIKDKGSFTLVLSGKSEWYPLHLQSPWRSVSTSVRHVAMATAVGTTATSRPCCWAAVL